MKSDLIPELDQISTANLSRTLEGKFSDLIKMNLKFI